MKRFLLAALACVVPFVTARADWQSNSLTGLKTYNVIAGASDNHAVIFASSAIVYHISVSNSNASSLAFLRLYNATTGFNGCNSATNMIGYWPIPASSTVGGREIEIGLGLQFSTGLSICVTGAAGFTDTTAAPASGVSVMVAYGR